MCQCWKEKDLSCLTGSELVYFLLHYSIYFVQSSRSTGSKSAPQYNTASTMPDSRYGVLGVKGLTFSFPNLLLLIVAKQLHFLFHMIRVFLQKVFFFVHVISSRHWLSFKVPRLDQGLFSCTAASSSCWCKTHLTVDTDSCLPAASNSLEGTRMQADAFPRTSGARNPFVIRGPSPPLLYFSFVKEKCIYVY